MKTKRSWQKGAPVWGVHTDTRQSPMTIVAAGSGASSQTGYWLAKAFPGASEKRQSLIRFHILCLFASYNTWTIEEIIFGKQHISFSSHYNNQRNSKIIPEIAVAHVLRNAYIIAYPYYSITDVRNKQIDIIGLVDIMGYTLLRRL